MLGARADVGGKNLAAVRVGFGIDWRISAQEKKLPSTRHRPAIGKK